MVALRSGEQIDPGEIERHYAQSPFIKRVHVSLPADRDTPGAGLRAVVVPDIEVLRRKRIVNVTELIRFELEGLSISLPEHQRVLDFEVSMPPATAGQAAGAPPHLERLTELVRRLAPRPAAVHADSNFELDLGLDSIERVELIAAIEQCLGARLEGARVQCAFTVRELADAIGAELTVRSHDAALVAPALRRDELWAGILDESAFEPSRLPGLVKDRLFTAAVVFAALRLASALLFRPRVRGIEHLPAAGPYILAPNHQSFLDAAAIAGVLPFGLFRQLFFIGATEYFETPVTAWLASRVNILPVDPDANLVPALQAGAYGLRAGKVLVVFPEGERSIDGAVKPFRRGAGILSGLLDVPIVPVAIDGMFEIWPRSRPLRLAKLLPWSGHRVRIAFGPPLPPRDHGKLRDEVARMWNELRRQ